MNPDDQLSEHFKRSEFACKDGCGFAQPAAELVAALESLRVAIDKPILIDDACRCAKHNAAVGGVPHSQHVLGTAADIRCPGLTARELYAEAAKIEAFKGFGVSENEYIHVDIRETPARWCYDAGGKQVPWTEIAA